MFIFSGTNCPLIIIKIIIPSLSPFWMAIPRNLLSLDDQRARGPLPEPSKRRFGGGRSRYHWSRGKAFVPWRRDGLSSRRGVSQVPTIFLFIGGIHLQNGSGKIEI